MATGNITTYDLTVGVKIDMDEAIYFLSPMDTPLLTGVNGQGNAVLPQMPVNQRKFYWMDEEALLPRSQLAAAITTGTTYITLQSGHHHRFRIGDILTVHEASHTETMKVAEYGTTADVIGVTRAYTGTAGDVASAVNIISIGMAVAEGSDPPVSRQIDRSERYNFTQIYGPEQVSITRTEQGVAKYGVVDELGHQMMLRIGENAISREQSFLYGVRSDSTTTKMRTSGGMFEFITTEADATNTQITIAKLSGNMAACWDNGGVPDTLIANPLSLATINAEDNDQFRTVISEGRRGEAPVSYVVTEFGDLQVVRNRWMWKANALAIKSGSVTRRVFDSLFTEKLAKTGDAEDWMLVCEEGLEVKGESHMFKMTTLTAY